MTLAITETWIRERVQLQDENLEDVKSLVLPGTYHEKITQLGPALHNFRRLKELDLSRNALECLDGLQHLSLLESLNLYYNNIGALNEVHKLRFNLKLQELDLRLNPVARNEPDYRLFAIHMLPSLRRLDDRGVRDQERKAALMHFGSDQAADFSGDKNPDSHHSTGPKEREMNTRAEYVSKMSVVPPIEADDTLMIDYVQGLEAPRQNGSVRTAESYERREILQMERGRGSDSGSNRVHDNGSNSNQPSSFVGVIDQYYPSLKSSNRDAAVKSHPPPIPNSSRNDNVSNRSTPVMYGVDNHDSHRPSLNNANSMSMKSKPESQFQCIIHRLCDLVDRYWNGSRSLHSHPKFIPNACNILSDLQAVVEDAKKPEAAQNVKLITALEKEVDDLRMRLRRLEGENQTLRETHRMEKNSDISEIERDNERLRSEINMMRVKLRAHEQTNELASMLRESHKALVETNDQLMRELSDSRNHANQGDRWSGTRSQHHQYEPEKVATARVDIQ